MKGNNKQNQKFKKGAASFYIIAFSTLILLVVAMSFAAIILSEVERTSNDDLSQSAYDSAMAGIEDGKLAYQKYMQCKGKDSSDCKVVNDLVTRMNTNSLNIDDSKYCDMVSTILGNRNIDNENNTGTAVDEGNYQTNGLGDSNNMKQKYTCTNLKTRMEDYEGSLSSSMPSRVIKLKFDEGVANNVDQVTFSWKTEDDDVGLLFNNYKGKVVFPSLTGMNAIASPATMSVGLVQTDMEFRMDDFERIDGSKTDRGLLYLVPTNGAGVGNIDADAFVQSNNKSVSHTPTPIDCGRNAGKEYPCSVTIGIPRPVNGGSRNPNTFMMVVSAPYGQPKTNFKLEFKCLRSGNCGSHVEEGSDSGTSVSKNVAMLDGVQIQIDSTGRANDLYRRIKARLESDTSASGAYLSILGPLELTGNNNDGSSNSFNLRKTLTVTCEATGQFGGNNC